MTLDQPVRRAVQTALDVDVVPQDVVRAVEDDEELKHIAEAEQSLRFAERCRRDAFEDRGGQYRERLRQTGASASGLLTARVEQLLRQEDIETEEVAGP